MNPSIALFGATGAVGESIAQELRSKNIPYRAVARSEESLRKTFGRDPLAELRSWDPESPATIVEAAKGIETVIYMVGVPYDQFHLHPLLVKKALDGAIAAGVKHFLLIATLYPFGRPRTAKVSETHPREPHTYKGKMRKEQEDLVMEAGASGKIQTTILRLPDFYGPGVTKSFLHGIFEGIATGKRAQMVGPIDLPHEFIYVPDIGKVVIKLIQEPKAYGQTWNLGGVGTIAPREFAQRAYALAGKKPRLLVANKFMLRVFGLFQPMMRELVEMHYLLTDPITIDDRALTRLLGPLPKTSYDEGLRACLAAVKPAI